MRARRRRAAWRWILLPLLALTMLAGAFWFGREVGGFEQAARVDALQRQVGQMEDLIHQTNLLRAQAEQQAAEAGERARAEIAALQARLPQGELSGIVELARAKLGEGVPAERLRFLIEAAHQRRCDPAIEKRRFAPRLPDDVTPLQTVSFLDNRITISGTAVAAANKDGVPQSWFDPAQPVEIRILHIGGDIELIKDTLPAGYSMVANDREYRLAFASSEKRGLVEASLQSCAYP